MFESGLEDALKIEIGRDHIERMNGVLPLVTVILCDTGVGVELEWGKAEHSRV